MENKDGYGNFDQKDHLYPDLPPVVNQIPPQSRLPVMKKCFCFSLRTGCLIVAWMNLIMRLCAIILLAVIGPSIIKALIGSVEKEAKNDPDFELESGDKELVTGIFQGVIIAIVVFLALLILVDLLLIVGIYKKKLGFMKTYMIITGILIVLGLLGSLKNTFTGIYGPSTVVQHLFGYIWLCFCFFLVHCYRIEIRNEEYLNSIGGLQPGSFAAPPRYEA